MLTGSQCPLVAVRDRTLGQMDHWSAPERHPSCPDVVFFCLKQSVLRGSVNAPRASVKLQLLSLFAVTASPVPLPAG